MVYRSATGAFVFAAALMMAAGGAEAADGPNYPDWSGQWIRIPVKLPTQPSHDQTKPWGRGQQAPLTPEYQKVLEDSIADQARGGLGNYPTARCIPGGMPRMMAAQRMEYIVTSEPTSIVGNADDQLELRRIFTDGRDWPKDGDLEPTYLGYSIGKW